MSIGDYIALGIIIVVFVAIVIYLVLQKIQDNPLS